MDMQVAAAGYIYIYLATKKIRRSRKNRRWWETRLCNGRANQNPLLNDLKFQEISGQYKNFTRMSPQDFEHLLNLIGGKITKRDTHMRESISAQDRLAVTLRFLATGDNFNSLQYLFRISRQAIGQIIPEVCQALCDVLQNIKIPAQPEEWEKIAKDYHNKWNFPHCIGAVDGKHVVIESPTGSASVFYNFKGFFSVVLFALVDADYNYMFVDVGAQGSAGDVAVFENSALGKKLAEGSLDLPEPRPLPGMESNDIPYFIVGDEAFALSDFLMRMYAGHFPKGSRQRLFNYRLCRARRVVENVFGITASVFRILRKPMALQPEKVSLIVLTITKLHNFLRQRKHSAERYTPYGTFDEEIDGEVVPGSWRNDSSMSSMLPLKRVARRPPLSAAEVRDKLSLYFATVQGRVPWQNKKA
ncbi:uncharacterized protein LOC128985495 [Macrosteles quadrilineatus]|uniref:uncharacterized protein LOC128985495 n=1 Tax=Macrosteles quadrilineatus TaxID=74068 RepID=UPI0023E0E70E|nr:uncharacterized protein LOC128985495 [Macrosteles quadrilineatus]